MQLFKKLKYFRLFYSGNTYIYQLMNRNYAKLNIEMRSWDGEKVMANYSRIRLYPSFYQYRLFVSNIYS